MSDSLSVWEEAEWLLDQCAVRIVETMEWYTYLGATLSKTGRFFVCFALLTACLPCFISADFLNADGLSSFNAGRLSSPLLQNDEEPARYQEIDAEFRWLVWGYENELGNGRYDTFPICASGEYSPLYHTTLMNALQPVQTGGRSAAPQDRVDVEFASNGGGIIHIVDFAATANFAGI